MTANCGLCPTASGKKLLPVLATLDALNLFALSNTDEAGVPQGFPLRHSGMVRSTRPGISRVPGSMLGMGPGMTTPHNPVEAKAAALRGPRLITMSAKRPDRPSISGSPAIRTLKSIASPTSACTPCQNHAISSAQIPHRNGNIVSRTGKKDQYHPGLLSPLE